MYMRGNTIDMRKNILDMRGHNIDMRGNVRYAHKVYISMHTKKIFQFQIFTFGI
jgi:hypothetical protein